MTWQGNLSTSLPPSYLTSAMASSASSLASPAKADGGCRSPPRRAADVVGKAVQLHRINRRLCIARMHTIAVDEALQSPLVRCIRGSSPSSQTLNTHIERPGGDTGHPSRRVMTAGIGCLVILAIAPKAAPAGEDVSSSTPPAAATAPSSSAEEEYVSSSYRVKVPKQWERKGKAGADVLWEDPTRRSTSVGVTVNPVRVRSIEEFGSLDTVGARLLDAERKKDSTLSVAMVSQSSRRLGDSDAVLYDYEYDLDSTRGRKRILNSVTIYASRLFILNAAYKCDRGEAVEPANAAACSVAARDTLDTLRRVAASFGVLPVAAS